MRQGLKETLPPRVTKNVRRNAVAVRTRGGSSGELAERELKCTFNFVGVTMTPDDRRLCDLSTRWTLIVRAHAADGSAPDAQAELLPRYCAAVYRHLLGLVRDEMAVEEICQEFAYRFVRGDFRHARPDRGRFRDYVAVAVQHLVGEYRQRQAKAEKLMPFDSRTFAAAVAPVETDTAFRDQWRRELLNRTWAALRRECTGDPPTLYDVLRRKADVPEMPSAKLAEEFSARTGRTLTAANARQMLHRARERFAALLRTEVKESIPTTDPAVADAELAELGLLVYVVTSSPTGGHRE